MPKLASSKILFIDVEGNILHVAPHSGQLMNSTVLPSRYFGMNRQCFAAARLMWPAYVDSRKRENCSVWKDLTIVALTCRRSVQFGCWITWLWMANCVSVMTKMLPSYNFTIPCRGRRNVTMCMRISRKPFLIGLTHSLWGPCQPPLTLRI